MTDSVEQSDGSSSSRVSTASLYALGIFTAANFLNYLDRSIVGILAEAIKADLHLDDAQLGFLLGTAFSVFYSIVGIAMGGIADRLRRKHVMAFGLVLWSSMTALGAMASSFFWLSMARFGVGIGEAVANPCSHSLLSDIFPKRNRSLALGVYLSGAYIGGALALLVGGYFLQNWPTLCVDVPWAGACSLASWKAALWAVGLPGIPLALILLTVQEPTRRVSAERGAAAAVIGRELTASLPPFTLLTVQRLAGWKGLLVNLAIVAGVCCFAWLMILITGDLIQWAAVSLGVYTILTWGQIQRLRDRPLFALTFGDPTFVLATLGASFIGCILGAVTSWSAPFMMRTYTLSPVEIGLTLGITHSVGALAGILLGGWFTDRWKLKDKSAPMWMCMICVSLAVPNVCLMLAIKDIQLFFVGAAGLAMCAAAWSGGVAAMVQDLVLPRMRGSAAACYSLVVLLVTFGVGPYWAGKVSAITGSLSAGLFSVLLLVPIALIVQWLAARRLPRETASRRADLARAAGEQSFAA